ncbi:dioxygenase [Streptomyces sp. NPDC003247]|uniref:dioxygenase family protein n=1 Tax=Streptomyces sp. NPDC003247 TaxID=3364677 RepID=UPI00369DD0E7
MSQASVPAEHDETTLTEAVVASFDDTPDARMRRCVQVLVKHLHAAVKELEPTMAEWEKAIDFLTATGQKCDDTRQEFVLLSDVLGVSSLVENINHRHTPEATAATVLGPFHMTESPKRELGACIDEVGGRLPCLVTGRVLAPDGAPLAGATVDVWQADENGYYDVQLPDRIPPGSGRGLFTTDDEGRFWFTTVVPSHYPIPTDGPVGQLLLATDRHPYRPAHIHFIADAPGHVPVTTHIFVEDSPYLDSDAVFAVKADLVRDFALVTDPAEAAAHGLPNPHARAEIDLVLEPVADQGTAGAAS